MMRSHGMVLSGGGAFGAYEAGVMKALFEDGTVDPVVYSGTSVGAYSAAVMCQGGAAKAALENLEKVWLNEVSEDAGRPNGVFRVRFNPLDYLNPLTWISGPAKPLADLTSDTRAMIQTGSRKAIDFISSKKSIGQRFLDIADFSALVSVEPFQNLIARTVDLAAIRGSAKQLRITATHWDHAGVGVNAAQVFRNADMTDQDGREVILASAAIPAVFPAVLLNDHWYVDGGLAANTPVGPAVTAGANEVHVIDLQADVQDLSIGDLDSTYEELVRSASILISAGIRREIERVRRENAVIRSSGAADGQVVVHRYSPKTPLGGFYQLLDFRKDFVASLIERGYQDAKNHNCADSNCAL